MAKKERFETVYSHGTIDVTQILVDTETGVNYVFRKVLTRSRTPSHSPNNPKPSIPNPSKSRIIPIPSVISAKPMAIRPKPRNAP